MGDNPTDAIAPTARALEKVADVFHKLAGPVADELGLLLGARVYEYRAKNLVAILKRTEAMFRKAGITPQMIPPRLALPALSAASTEDDENLQERWAALLANAASPDTAAGVLPCFSDILKQLTPPEVKFLDRACDLAGGWMITLPEGAAPVSEPAPIQGEFLGSLQKAMVGNLERLGMIRRVLSREESYLFTELGRAFVKACRAPESLEKNVTVT